MVQVVNLKTVYLLGCQFGTTCDSMVTKFKLPANGDVYAMLRVDPSYVLKLVRNDAASIASS